MNPFDLRFDLAVQAAKALDAKIEQEVEAAFDDGMDFVRSVDLVTGGDFMSPRPLDEPVVMTISYKGGPIAPDYDTPAQCIRYNRPKGWRRGQKLRGTLPVDASNGPAKAPPR